MKNKKGISEIIAYVLLISFAISISVLIYAWMTFYAKPIQENSCPEGVSLILKEDKCTQIPFYKINITVQNKGRFNIDGYVIRASNKTGIIPVSNLLFENDSKIYFTSTLVPGAEDTKTFDFSSLSEIVEVEIEPFRIVKEKIVYCEKSTIRQKISDCPGS